MKTINLGIICFLFVNIIISTIYPEYRNSIFANAISVISVTYSAFFLGMQYQKERQYGKPSGPVRRFFLVIYRLFVYDVGEGERIRRFHGIAYFLPEQGRSVTVLMPFHFVVGLIVRTYYAWMHRFKREKFYTVIGRAYSIGYKDGTDAYISNEVRKRREDEAVISSEIFLRKK